MAPSTMAPSTTAPAPRRTRFSLRDDRGATSIMTALLMVVLLAFGAISLDIAAMQAERQQLQTGADAAALAIAQDCGRHACGNPAQTAQQFADDNITTGDHDVTAALAQVPTPSTGRVTVTTTGVAEHLFAPVIGVDQTSIGATATAGWGVPSGGTAALPLTFSHCEFLAQTGGGLPSGTTQRTIYFPKTSDTGCTGPSGNLVPGGFGWLPVNAGSCRTRSAIGDVVWSDTGNNVPAGCSSQQLSAAVGRTVLLPIFDESGGTGSGAWYKIRGYAAFHLTGYRFSGTSVNPGPCNGDDRCVRGYFTKFVDLTDAFQYSPGAPQYGASVVSLLPDPAREEAA